MKSTNKIILSVTLITFLKFFSLQANDTSIVIDKEPITILSEVENKGCITELDVETIKNYIKRNLCDLIKLNDEIKKALKKIKNIYNQFTAKKDEISIINPHTYDYTKDNDVNFSVNLDNARANIIRIQSLIMYLEWIALQIQSLEISPLDEIFTNNINQIIKEYMIETNEKFMDKEIEKELKTIPELQNYNSSNCCCVIL